MKLLKSLIKYKEFNHPCKSYFKGYSDIAKNFNEHLNFSNSIDIIQSKNPIQDVLLNIGQERFGEEMPTILKMKYPRRHTCPRGFYICVSFSLKPEQMQPLGTCNFKVWFRTINKLHSKLPASNTRVYALNYNILNVKGCREDCVF